MLTILAIVLSLAGCKPRAVPISHVINLTPLSSRSSYLNTFQELDERVVWVLEKLILDAQEDGMCLTVRGSFRTFAYQQKLYDEAKDKTKVALPGQSEHHTGLAIDFEGCPMTDGKRDDQAERLELRKDFDQLPEYLWLQKNAMRYNLYESYRQDNQSKTGFPPEPWHWKFKI